MNVRLLKLLDATAGGLLCWVGGHWLHLRHRGGTGTGGSPLPGAGIKRILVVRPGGLGDMILLLPLLKRLRERYPGAAIDLVCEQRNRDIPALAGDPAELLLYDAHPVRTLLQLLRRRYDLSIDTEQFHNFSAVMIGLGGAPVRIGFKINPSRNPLYTHLINYDLTGYEADEFMKLLAPLGLAGPANVEGCLAAPGGRGPSPERLILIHVGASTRYKRWAPEKFAELTRRVLNSGEKGPVDGGHETPGGVPAGQVRVGLVGDARDKPLAQRIARLAGAGNRVEVMAGEMTLAQTAALIGRAEGFIGGDSGLAHLAVALAVPTVVLFGPSDPMKWAARNPHHVVVRKDLACSPCFIFGYHKLCHSIACMADLTVDDVMRGIERIPPASLTRTTAPASIRHPHG